jgi:hypothetical protein
MFFDRLFKSKPNKWEAIINQWEITSKLWEATSIQWEKVANDWKALFEQAEKDLQRYQQLTVQLNQENLDLKLKLEYQAQPLEKRELN